MDFEQLFQAAADNPVAAIIAAVVIAVIIPVVGLLRVWLVNRNPNKQSDELTPLAWLLPLVLAPLLLSGCGSYSQARMDQHERSKADLVYVAERAMQDKLTATELRSKLQTQDTAMLAEQAHKGEGLEELRTKLEADSDEKVAKLFNGDNGREDPPGG